MRIFDRFGGSVMAQLIVRDLPAELVLALKRRPLAAVLAAIPNVGEDGDFRREQNDRR
jgi:hypothetical protein